MEQQLALNFGAPAAHVQDAPVDCRLCAHYRRTPWQDSSTCAVMLALPCKGGARFAPVALYATTEG